MKCLRRYFYVLLCCVLLLGAFSITVSAETVKAENYHVYQTDIISTPNWQAHKWINVSTNIIPNDGVVQKLESSAFITGVQATYDWQMYHESSYSIANDDKSALFTGGRLVKVRLENARHYLLMMNSTKMQAVYYSYPDTVTFTVQYKDGSTETFSGATGTSKGNDGNIDLYIEFTPSKDVYSVTFTAKTNFYNYIKNNESWDTTDSVSYQVYLGEWDGDYKYQFSYEQSSEESGLLSGLIGWVKNIFDSVKNGFSALGDGLNNVLNSIKDLPAKIWGFIENGLKSLFVPDEQFIIDFKARIDNMLSEKLGAVYQVVDITLNSWDRIQASDQTNTIEIPVSEIDVSNGEKFSFGGYNVPIVPEKFGFLAEMAKLAIGIVCTLLFVNGMRKKYDEVMGVEQ